MICLLTLKSATPGEGNALAAKMMAHVAIKVKQPDAEVRAKLRLVYVEDADALIASSQVAATHFVTVAANNNYWRDAS